MAIKAFNSIAGFSVGNIPANIILGNGDITAGNANFSGNGNIVGNIYTGNADLGNLAIANYFIGNFQGMFANGNSNIDIPDANGNINLSAGGNANILVITPTGAYIQGTLDITGDANIGNVLITPDSFTIGNSVVDANGLRADTANIGNVVISTDAINIGNTTLDANGLIVDSANISGSANIGNVLITPDAITIGNSVLDANGLIADNANISGNANIGNVVITPDAITIGNSVLDANGLIADNANISGNANIGNVVISTDAINIGNTTLDANGLIADNANISGNANIGNVLITPDAINIGNTTLDANGLIAGNVVINPDSLTIGNSVLDANGLRADTANIGNVVISTDAINVGNTTLDANGLISDSANIGNVLITPDAINIGNSVLDANGLLADSANIGNLTVNFANITANLEVADTANIGNVRTDNLLYSNGQPWDLQQPAGSNTYIQYNDNGSFGASYNLTYDDSNGLTLGTNATMYGNVTLYGGIFYTQSDIQVQGNANISYNLNANYVFLIDANASGNIYASNFSSVNDLSVGANANILGTLTANNISITTDLSVTGNANITNDVNANNVNTSNNVNAAGNVSGTYILGNGFYLTDINTSILSNGNSNVKVYENSNVAISVAGNANVLVISSTGINVTSTINSGDITANGNISANVIAVTDANVSNATVSGSVITSQISAPVNNITIAAAAGDYSIFLQPTGNGTVDANSARITSVATPNNATDAVNKQYVDDVVQGLNIHDSCLVATPNTLANITGGVVSYNNGVDGVGANLTTTTSYTLIDNVSVANVGTRILVKDEIDQAWNGIYVYSTSNVITRASDYNTVPEIEAGDYTFVSSGDTYDNTGWVQVNNITTIGTDPIIFTQFSGAGTYTAGPGIALNGVQFSANTDGITTAIIGSNIVVKANAEFTTPNIGAATGTSLIVTGNLSGNNLSISNIANVGLDLNVFGNIQGNNISSNGNLSGNNLSAINNVSAGANIIGSNITSNNSIIANANITANAGLYGNTLDLNSSANILGNIYLGANKINEIVNSSATTLEIRGGWNNTAGILNLAAGDYANNNNWAKIGIIGNSSGNAIIDNEANISYWKQPGNANSIVTINTLNTISGNYTSGALVVNGGVGIRGELNANGNVILGNLTANAPSIDSASGALVVYGGAGIGGNLNIFGNIATGGNITAQGNATVSTSVTLGNTALAWTTIVTTSNAANQTLANLQITGSTVTGIEFLVKGVDQGVASSEAKYSVASVLVVTDGSNVNWTTYGTVRIGGSTGDLAAGTILNGGNNFVQLWVTPSSSNSTVWVTQYRTI